MSWLRDDDDDDDTLSAAEMIVSGNICYIIMRVIAGFLKEGHHTTVGLSTMAIFSIFSGYFFGNFGDVQPLVRDPKCMTLNDPE